MDACFGQELAYTEVNEHDFAHNKGTDPNDLLRTKIVQIAIAAWFIYKR